MAQQYADAAIVDLANGMQTRNSVDSTTEENPIDEGMDEAKTTEATLIEVTDIEDRIDEEPPVSAKPTHGALSDETPVEDEPAEAKPTEVKLCRTKWTEGQPAVVECTTRKRKREQYEPTDGESTEDIPVEGEPAEGKPMEVKLSGTIAIDGQPPKTRRITRNGKRERYEPTEAEKEEKERIVDMVLEHFRTHYGQNTLACWQAISRDIGMEAGVTPTGCKQILKTVHFNIFDFVRACKKGKLPRRFATEKDLADYKKEDWMRRFPLKIAECNPILAWMLIYVDGRTD